MKPRFDNISVDRSELQLFGRKVLIVAATLIAIALLWAVRDVLILIAFAAILAAGIAPAVQRVRILGRHWFHRHISRGTAVLIVYFPFLFRGALLGIVGAIIAIPAAAVIQVTFEETFVEWRERRHDSVRAGTLIKRRD